MNWGGAVRAHKPCDGQGHGPLTFRIATSNHVGKRMPAHTCIGKVVQIFVVLVKIALCVKYSIGFVRLSSSSEWCDD